MKLKKYWLMALTVLLVLSVTLLTLASCNLAHESAGTVPQAQNDCSRQKVSSSSNGSPTTRACQRRLLVFSKTGGFRPSSLKDGKIALQKLVIQHKLAGDLTEDSSVFTPANLAHVYALFFLLTYRR